MTQEPEPQAERLGRLAFAYCKIGTVSLLCGRFALPVAAVLSATLFLVSYMKGKKDTKCIGRYPLGVAAFWLCILTLWLLCQFRVLAAPDWLRAYFGI